MPGNINHFFLFYQSSFSSSLGSMANFVPVPLFSIEVPKQLVLFPPLVLGQSKELLKSAVYCSIMITREKN